MVPNIKNCEFLEFIVPSKKIIYRRGIFPVSFPNLGM